MTDDQDGESDAAPDDELLYEEQGGSRWALLFGPIFAGAGICVELLTGGPVFFGLWLTVAVVLGAFSALWVYARRRHAVVRVTTSTLRQGQETIPVDTIAEVVDVAAGHAPPRARVLGGGLAAPRKYAELPLRLRDGSLVLAWGRDGDAMRSALRDAIEA